MPFDINSITQFLADNAILLIAVGAVLYLIYTGLKKNKQAKYKPVILEKEIRRLVKELFEISQEKHGYGKTLFIGSRHSGFVLQSIMIPYNRDIKIALKDNLEYQRQLRQLREDKAKHQIDEYYDERINDLKQKYKNNTAQEKERLVAFKVCGKSKLNKLIANLLSMGIKYHIVNKELMSEDATSFFISHECRPTNKLGIFTYDNSAKAFVDRLAKEFNADQIADSVVNFVPKLSFLELEQAKNRSSLEFMAELDKAKKKSMIEDVKKGNV